MGRRGGPGRRGYPAEFRRRVIDLLGTGRKVADVARDLGVSEQAIYGWRRQERIDRYAPQILTSATEHQICHSHQARDLTFAVEADTGEARLWAVELRHVFGRAIRLHHERDQVAPETFARRWTLIENATDRLVFDRYLAPKTEAARLQQRYRTHRDSLYVFLAITGPSPLQAIPTRA